MTIVGRCPNKFFPSMFPTLYIFTCWRTQCAFNSAEMASPSKTSPHSSPSPTSRTRATRSTPKSTYLEVPLLMRSNWPLLLVLLMRSCHPMPSPSCRLSRSALPFPLHSHYHSPVHWPYPYLPPPTYLLWENDHILFCTVTIY